MRLPRTNNWIAVLIILLVVNVIPPATTPVDQWTGWTFFSLLSAVLCIVFLLIEIISRRKMKHD